MARDGPWLNDIMIKYSIKVGLKPRAGSDLFPIRLRVSWCGVRCDLALGASYDPKKWIQEIGRAKQNTRNSLRQSAADINRYIEEVVAFISDIFARASVDGVVPDVESIKNAFSETFGKKSAVNNGSDTLAIFSEFVQSMAVHKSWSWNTERKYNIVRNIIKKTGIKINGLNEAFLDSFVASELEQGHKNPTIAKNLQVLKAFLKFCNKRKYIEYDCTEYKPRLIWPDGNKKAVVYLERSELLRLISADCLSTSLSATRDVFVFCCFSGLRFSDVMALKKTDISQNGINTVTLKTSDDLFIEFNKWSVGLYEKYKDTPGDYLFPSITNQVFNRELKDIFKILEFDRPIKKISFSGSRRIETIKPLYDVISSHTARRTFVVQALRHGIPAEVVMGWTGHKDYEAMRPYIAIVSELSAENMKKFDDF